MPFCLCSVATCATNWEGGIMAWITSSLFLLNCEDSDTFWPARSPSYIHAANKQSPAWTPIQKVYLHDILIYSETMNTLNSCEQCWRNWRWQMLNSSSEHHEDKIKYLGSQISHKGVEMVSENFKAVLECSLSLHEEAASKFLRFCKLLLAFYFVLCTNRPTHHKLIKNERGGKAQA